MNRKKNETCIIARILLFAVIILSATTMQSQPLRLILGGELSNSAVTSTADIDSVMPRMKRLGLNTVLAPAYWEFIEPTEGEYDFTLVDRIILQARNNDLKVVFLWFGAWKNSMSCYAPLWFKTDTRRFPRARTADGKPLEIASCFSQDVFQADNQAFGMFVQHISQVGSDVVTMVQVENEIGMLEDARDHSTLANNIYNKGVPSELIDYLKRNEKHLHPELRHLISTYLQKIKTASWTGLFGNTPYTDEIFMAYYYARYVDRLCQTARRYTQIPLYVNAALNSRGRLPGQYPSGGPLAYMVDIWHAAAPQLLCLAPDIYDTGFKSWADQYALPGNPLFIPESRCCINSGARAMYAFGQHRALGFSPFAIDQAAPDETASVTHAYSLIAQLEPYITGERQTAGVWGMLLDQDDRESIITDADRTIRCRHYFTLPWDPRATDGTTWPEGGAILIKISKDEFLLAGTGVVVEFATNQELQHEQQKQLGEDGFIAEGNGADNATKQTTKFRGSRIGLGTVDEVSISPDGHINYIRRMNGDQDHQGRHVRISCGEWKILHIRLYEYS